MAFFYMILRRGILATWLFSYGQDDICTAVQQENWKCCRILLRQNFGFHEIAFFFKDYKECLPLPLFRHHTQAGLQSGFCLPPKGQFYPQWSTSEDEHGPCSTHYTLGILFAFGLDQPVHLHPLKPMPRWGGGTEWKGQSSPICPVLPAPVSLEEGLQPQHCCKAAAASLNHTQTMWETWLSGSLNALKPFSWSLGINLHRSLTQVDHNFPALLTLMFPSILLAKHEAKEGEQGQNHT